MHLKKLLDTLKFQTPDAQKLGVAIDYICTDTRKIDPSRKGLFVVMRGTQRDAHAFIPEILQKGVAAIVYETAPDAELMAQYAEKTVFVQVADTAETLGYVASAFYGHPSQTLKVVGVTGTNGKTTTATLLYKLFSRLGYFVGLISTVEYKIGQTSYPSTHTTPDALVLQGLFAEMLEAGCEYVFMEVSSHAAHQKRIAGTRFRGGIFTNMSHDHLDYHKTFAEYIAAKKLFFDALPKDAFALVNLDDKRGEVMLQNCAARRQKRYALRTLTDFHAQIVDNTLSGLVLRIGNEEVYTRLVGDFNAYNLLAVYGAACLSLETQPDAPTPAEILRILSNLEPVDGRFETVYSPDRAILGIVDYAHTPDALEKVLDTLQKIQNPDSQLITVVGCGGDRDKTKRPIMAKIACERSQKILLTSDNPRTEAPEQILADMWVGVGILDKNKTEQIVDRRAAIARAVELAKPGDIILVAGKGHEKYQEINHERSHFDDKEVLNDFFAAS